MNSKIVRNIIVMPLALGAVYLTSFYNYLLFHVIAEAFSIVIGVGIFVFAWNSQRYIKNNYFLFLGIAYLFISIIDLLHTYAYKGMGVFVGFDTNLPTQLWIAARYLEGISLLVAFLFFKRKLKPHLQLFIFFAITCLVLISIFYLNIFPDCFIEGEGLTPFKKTSEYFISLILLFVMILFYQFRHQFEKYVYRLLITAVGLTMLAELAFTFYVHSYGLSNLVGHFFKIISFYLIYKAIIETGLTKPYDLLFRDLKQSEDNLQRTNRRLNSEIIDRRQIENAHQSIIGLYHQVTGDTSIDDILKKGLEEGIHLTGSKIGYIHFINPDQETISLQWWSDETMQQCAVTEKTSHYPISEAGVWVDCLDQKKPVIHNNYKTLPHKKGMPKGHVPVVRDLAVPVFENRNIVAILGVGNKSSDYHQIDSTLLLLLAENIWSIVRRHRSETKIKSSLIEKETLLQEIHHRVKNNMAVVASLLKLQMDRIEDGKTRDILKESQSRIYAMSAVHETLHASENLSEIDLKTYLPKIITTIFQTYSFNPDQVKLNIEIEKIPISINQASPLGLVLSELISNSLKYAFPDEKKGTITVGMKKLDNELELTVHDNGIGMPEGLDWKNSKSLGLKLVRTLVENQLDGSIVMENRNGTKFIVKFKIDEA